MAQIAPPPAHRLRRAHGRTPMSLAAVGRQATGVCRPLAGAIAFARNVARDERRSPCTGLLRPHPPPTKDSPVNKKPAKRLVINKQTVRAMNHELAQVNGAGNVPIHTDACMIVLEPGNELR
jgi:hypothetical protein